MYFKCDTSKIKLDQLTAIVAIDSLFNEQNMRACVISLEPLVFEVKAQLSSPMLKRLIVDRVPIAISGYTGELVGGNLVISQESTKPAKQTRARAS